MEGKEERCRKAEGGRTSKGKERERDRDRGEGERERERERERKDRRGELPATRSPSIPR